MEDSEWSPCSKHVQIWYGKPLLPYNGWRCQDFLCFPFITFNFYYLVASLLFVIRLFFLFHFALTYYKLHQCFLLFQSWATEMFVCDKLARSWFESYLLFPAFLLWHAWMLWINFLQCWLLGVKLFNCRFHITQCSFWTTQRYRKHHRIIYYLTSIFKTQCFFNCQYLISFFK